MRSAETCGADLAILDHDLAVIAAGFARAAGRRAAIVAAEAALKSAEWTLEAVKKSIKVVPVDSAPEVVALTAQLGTEEAGLKVAQGTQEAARGADRGVEAAVKAIGNGLTALKINRLGAAGSLAGIVSGGREGKAPVLIVDVSIHGSRHVYREGMASLKNEFRTLADEIAKEVAKEVLKAFEKT